LVRIFLGAEEIKQLLLINGGAFLVDWIVYGWLNPISNSFFQGSLSSSVNNTAFGFFKQAAKGMVF
jgi:hypothetical protein